MTHEPVSTAGHFVDDLRALQSPVARERNAPLAADDADEIIGVPMGQIFALAKKHMTMDLDAVEQLLDSPVHEVRVGAVSIMDWQARHRKTTQDRRRDLYKLYMRRHDRINSWDLVDRSAIHVVGEYLADKPRDVLYRLAASKRPMERRTALVSTFAFIRRGEVEDAFRLAESLVADDHHLVHTAVGWVLREAGHRDKARLADFLDRHAATMPRVMLRHAIEKLPPTERARYLGASRRLRT